MTNEIFSYITIICLLVQFIFILTSYLKNKNVVIESIITSEN